MKNIKTTILLAWAILATIIAGFQTYSANAKSNQMLLQKEIIEKEKQMAEAARLQAEIARKEAIQAQLMAQESKLEAMKALAECQASK